MFLMLRNSLPEEKQLFLPQLRQFLEAWAPRELVSANPAPMKESLHRI